MGACTGTGGQTDRTCDTMRPMSRPTPLRAPLLRSLPRLFAGALCLAAVVVMAQPADGAAPAPRKKAAHKAASAASAKAAGKGSAKARGKASRAAATGKPYAGNAEAMQWADEMAKRQGIDAGWARRALGEARQLPAVQRLIQPPAPGTRKNWAAYRARFIDDRRVAAGLRFMEGNRAALARAEKEYGVPADIVAGIIGVETFYGQHMGQFRVLDALATLSFDHPPEHPRLAERVAFFRSELEQFLALAAKNGGDPQVPLGSFAGAIGLPQFMPSSWVRWGVDFDGDGRIDLRRSASDAIGSVANYFKAHGWQAGLATHYPVAFDASRVDMDTLLAPDILPTFTAARFQQLGAVLEGPAQAHAGPLALVELQNGDAPNSYVAGTENFYAITRYNQSSYYAMAVIELARALREAPQASAPATADKR